MRPVQATKFLLALAHNNTECAMSSLTQPATPFRHPAADGYSLGGFRWRHAA
jgi:hypothetical protein